MHPALLKPVHAKPIVYGMLAKNFKRAALVAALAFSATIPAGAARPISEAHGDRLAQKIDAIAKNAAAEPARPSETPVSELELNSYLQFHLAEQIPRGLTDPRISLLGEGNVGGRVLVDVDEFKRHRRSGGIMDPLSYISGRVPVTARGVLRTSKGIGQFHLTSAEMHGVPLPKAIVQELVSFFSRTPERPRGFDLDQPVELPAKIREVVIRRGEALVVQ